jgi:nicotinamidase-related amidase
MTPDAPVQGGLEGQKKRVALMLIDFQQRHRGSFTYEHGPLCEGISRASSVISSARSSGIPVILVSGKVTRDVFPEISEAAGTDAIRIYKKTMDAFKEPDLETILGAYDVDTIAMGGWIRHLCVMATTAEALKRGFSVMTSDEILFGNRETANLAARRMCLEYYRKNCSLFDSSADLIAGMERRIGLRAL